MQNHQQNFDPSHIDPSNVTKFCIGLVLGLLPNILFLLINRNGTSGTNLGTAIGLALWGGVLFLGVLVVMITCLTNPSLRPYGYGLLAALLLSPIILAIGCRVIVPKTILSSVIKTNIFSQKGRDYAGTAEKL